MTWLPDPRAVRDAEAAFEAADSLAAKLLAAGRLVALDRTESLTPIGPSGRDAITLLLAREETRDALEDDAVRVRELLEADGEAEAIVGLLDTRARAEYELLGAAFLVGTPIDPGSCLAFDAIVRPWVWRLTEANVPRRARLANVTPRLHERFWWWSEGVGIDAQAVSAMSAAAQLVARFPNARKRFDGLVRAEETWLARRPAVVRTLRRWLAPSEDLSLAAAGHDERTVLTTKDVELSFVAPDRLIIDLLADRRGAEVPSLGAFFAAPVANTNERFVVALREEDLDGTRLVLTLPLATGDVTLVLPPE